MHISVARCFVSDNHIVGRHNLHWLAAQFTPSFNTVSWPVVIALGNGLSPAQRGYFLNTFRPRQNCRHFAGDIFKYIFLNENIRISLKISLKSVPNVPITNIPTLVQIMAWRRPGAKPLSKPMMVILVTHICVTRPQWVNKRGRIVNWTLKDQLFDLKYRYFMWR